MAHSRDTGFVEVKRRPITPRLHFTLWPINPSLMMSGPKKRKVDKECRVFNKEWITKYFFTEHRSSAVCLICQETVAVFKEYNISRHFATKLANDASNLSTKEWEAAAPNLRRTAQTMLALFGSTYVCEQTFSVMNINKASHRSKLTDQHLRSILRLATTKLTPDFDALAKKGDQQHCSH